jgi:hypothetical protein
MEFCKRMGFQKDIHLQNSIHVDGILKNGRLMLKRQDFVFDNHFHHLQYEHKDKLEKVRNSNLAIEI